MKLIDRHEFLNGKAFEIYFLSEADRRRFSVPECDVIGLRRVSDEDDRTTVMRPDEALIAARLLIDAVHRVTEGYVTSGPKDNDALAGCERIVKDLHRQFDKSIGRDESKPLAMELVEDLEAADDDETKSAEAFAERAWSGNE